MATMEALKTIRKVKNLTQQKLADLAGCSKSLISKIEKGERTATPQIQQKIRKALKELSS